MTARGLIVGEATEVGLIPTLPDRVPLLLLSPSQAASLLPCHSLRALEAAGELVRLEVGRRCCYREPDVWAVLVRDGVDPDVADTRVAWAVKRG